MCSVCCTTTSSEAILWLPVGTRTELGVVHRNFLQRLRWKTANQGGGWGHLYRSVERRMSRDQHFSGLGPSALRTIHICHSLLCSSDTSIVRQYDIITCKIGKGNFLRGMNELGNEQSFGLLTERRGNAREPSAVCRDSENFGLAVCTENHNRQRANVSFLIKKREAEIEPQISDWIRDVPPGLGLILLDFPRVPLRSTLGYFRVFPPGTLRSEVDGYDAFSGISSRVSDSPLDGSLCNICASAKR